MKNPTKVTYTRLYADGNGESHFADESMPMSEVDFAPPAPLVRLSNPMKAEKLFIIRLPAGMDADWHRGPSKQMFSFVSGTLVVTTSDGEQRTFGAGDILLEEDTVGKGHLTSIGKEEDVVAVITQVA